MIQKAKIFEALESDELETEINLFLGEGVYDKIVKHVVYNVHVVKRDDQAGYYEVSTALIIYEEI
jgi:hypothetical protein